MSTVKENVKWKLGLLSKLGSEKISRIGFRYSAEKSIPFTEFRVSRKKAYSEVQNGKNVFFKVIRVFFFVLEWFGTSLCFSLL
jgi:hypothetical protein